MTDKKILVVGGGKYQRDLIIRLKDKGYYVLCIDKNPKALGFEFADQYEITDVCDKEKCLEYAKKHNIDAIMTNGATITLPTVAYIGEKLNLPHLNGSAANISVNKYKIKDTLAKNGCNIWGEYFQINSIEEGIKRNYSYPVVIKPCDGSGSVGVNTVYSEEELKSAVQNAFENARFNKIYCEKLINGAEYSAEAFVYNSKTYIYGIIKTTFVKRDGNDISYGHRVPGGLPENTEKLIEKEVDKACKALKINMGSVNFDIILNKEDGKPYIIDCGIRIGQNLIASHLVPYSAGVNVIDNNISAALGEKTDPEIKFRKYIATRLLICNPGIISEIEDCSSLIGTNNIIDIVFRKSKGDVQKEYKDKSDTCGWVICQGNSAEDAENNAEKALYLVKDKIHIH